MSDDDPTSRSQHPPESGRSDGGRPRSPAAERALAEAAARRREIDERAARIAARPELQGRGGLDPVRYEDWEIGGRAVDF